MSAVFPHNGFYCNLSRWYNIYTGTKAQILPVLLLFLTFLQHYFIVLIDKKLPESVIAGCRIDLKSSLAILYNNHLEWINWYNFEMLTYFPFSLFFLLF